MNCNCIEELSKAIEKEYGDGAKFTNTRITFNIKTGKMSTSFEPLTFRYHPKKADGSLSKKWEKTHIVFNFCPICGKRIQRLKISNKDCDCPM